MIQVNHLFILIFYIHWNHQQKMFHFVELLGSRLIFPSKLKDFVNLVKGFQSEKIRQWYPPWN